MTSRPPAVPSPRPRRPRRAAGLLAVLATAAAVLVGAASPAAADDPVSTSVSVTGPDTQPVSGQPFTVVATVDGTDAGSVQFSMGDADQGDPVPLDAGSATSPELSAMAGTHTVTATFTPADTATYAGSTAAVDVVVKKARTSVTVTVTPSHIIATVTTTAPGTPVPTGVVTFTSDNVDTLGDVELENGVADLDYTLPAGGLHTATAWYAGDGAVAESLVTVTRADPTITTRLTSAHPVTRYGWYRDPVTVSFACTPHGAALTQACPSPVTVSSNGAAQHVAGSVSAGDGGVGTTLATVSVDRTAPTVGVTGVTNGGRYFGVLPAIRCAASDPLSGVAACAVQAAAVKGTEQVRYTATATDRAGNTRTTSGAVTVSTLALSGATFANGYYTLHAFTTYTVLVRAATRPTYLKAVAYPGRPAVTGGSFSRSGSVAGAPRWVYSVPVTKAWKAHPYWNLGIKVGRTVQTLKVRVVA